LDYKNQGNVVLAVDTSYIGVGFYIYQEDIHNPKKHYYAKFGSKALNEREARFSQPKRELFGLKEALRLNKRWLIGARKLIIETDAKYIKGMLQNPDMMPNATINRWIDEISLFHFVLRHKAGKTFGPDGLSRRPVQPGDAKTDPCDGEAEGEPEPLRIEIVDPEEPQPRPIEEFVDQIDTRGGYFYDIAESLEDFDKELSMADGQRDYEKSILQKSLLSARPHLPEEQVQYVQQLVEILDLGSEDDPTNPATRYDEEHRSVGAKRQDELIRLYSRFYMPM
jgi:hypothetical protein